MENRVPRYIVYAPAYHAENGGAIFQHELVNALRKFGQDAYLWPMAPIFPERRLRRLRNRILPPRYVRNPALDTPLADPELLGDQTIVVYPELVPGNPLQAKNIVRWLLYKPGVRHPYSFTKHEMFFRAFEKADMPERTGGAPDLHMWKINRTYRNENRPDRKGVAYILRKGEHKPRIPETESPDAIRIDGLSHEKVNEIFNRVERFYSYDEATMYSQYAAVCGCLSIVVPGDHASRADLEREHDLYRFGIAYGTDEAELIHARATGDRVLPMLETKQEEGLDTVRNFIALTRARFQRGWAA